MVFAARLETKISLVEERAPLGISDDDRMAPGVMVMRFAWRVTASGRTATIPTAETSSTKTKDLLPDVGTRGGYDDIRLIIEPARDRRGRPAGCASEEEGKEGE